MGRCSSCVELRSIQSEEEDEDAFCPTCDLCQSSLNSHACDDNGNPVRCGRPPSLWLPPPPPLPPSDSADLAALDAALAELAAHSVRLQVTDDGDDEEDGEDGDEGAGVDRGGEGGAAAAAVGAAAGTGQPRPGPRPRHLAPLRNGPLKPRPSISPLPTRSSLRFPLGGKVRSENAAMNRSCARYSRLAINVGMALVSHTSHNAVVRFSRFPFHALPPVSGIAEANSAPLLHWKPTPFFRLVIFHPTLLFIAADLIELLAIHVKLEAVKQCVTGSFGTLKECLFVFDDENT